MIDFKCWAFTTKVINHGEYTEASAVIETVRYEIHGPVLVDPFRPVHDHPEMADALLTLLQAQRKAFFLVKAFGAFVIDHMPFPTQQGMKTWRAEFTPLLSQLTQTGSDLGVVLWFRLVPATAPAQPDNHTGPSLAEQEPLFEMDHDVPPGSRRYHFF